MSINPNQRLLSKINLSVVQHSTTENVDVFLGSLHEDVVYLHEEYEAKFDKNIWRKAFLRQMERGGYANTVEANTVLKSVIHGYQTAAVEFVSRYRNQEDTEITSSPSRLAILSSKTVKSFLYKITGITWQKKRLISN